MEPATATCGCGRPMRVDALVGPLAFRCGCGARFNLVAPHFDKHELRCVYVSGTQRCRDNRLPEVPVCKLHAEEIAAAVEGTLKEFKRKHDEDDDTPIETAEERLRKAGIRQEYRSREEIRHDLHVKKLPGSVVYYVRVRPGQIKIGTTINLDARLKSMRLSAPGDLLAAEPGERAEEKVRHAKFAELRLDCRREDFEEGDELLAHIKRVRAKYGDPHTLPARLVAEAGGETVISA